eukprot:scaffold7826_cov54-Phaeocystis_antarctica.AAC.1
MAAPRGGHISVLVVLTRQAHLHPQSLPQPRDFSVCLSHGVNVWSQMDLTHSPLITPGAAQKCSHRRPWSELIDEQTSASFYQP